MTSKMTHRCATLVYHGMPGYYLIVCKECGECAMGAPRARTEPTSRIESE